MKKFVFSALSFLLSVIVLGCQKGAFHNNGRIASDNDFPQVLVGTWKADQHDWQITFDPNGQVSSIVHTLWALPLSVKEGGYMVEGPDEGTFAMFVLGRCKADYDNSTRRLDVEINLDDFTMKLPQGELEGRCQDFFKGTVSKNGRTWKANWFGYSWLEGAQPPNREEIEANPVPLVFTKVDPNIPAKANQ